MFEYITNTELIVISIYLVLLLSFFILILKRVRDINIWHANKTWIKALKFWCALVRRRLIVTFIILFLLSSYIIINLI